MWQDSSYSYQLIGEYDEYLYNKEYVFSIQPVYDFIIYSYDEYSKECYADSSEIITHECPDHIPGCSIYHTNKIIIHNKPTFEGYIEFIRKKYK
jgi:hypothetical protein